VILAFIGDNGHAREQAATEFIAGFVGVHGAMAVDKFAAEELDYATLSDAVATIPFLSPRRLVIIRDLSANKLLAEQLEQIMTVVADTTDLVIIEGHVDGRSKYLSNLRKLTEVREFTTLDGDELIGWVVDITKSLGGEITMSLAGQLVDRVGTNQQLLANELTKLVLYQPQITSDSIIELTAYTPQGSIFAMLDAAFAGNVGTALKLYAEQRTQGMEPQAILGMVTWQLHILTLVKAAGSMPANDIASRAKLSPFVVRKNQTNARRINNHKMIELLEKAVEIDKIIKTTGVNTDDAVQSLIISFA
jgi:DNA polymerase-3 subunit delta